MRSSVLAAACAVALSLSPDPLHAAGPEDRRRAAAEPCADEQQPSKSAWGGRFGEWLRRQLQADGPAHRSYYLRSPLLYAFGPERSSPDCDDAPEAPDAPAASSECELPHLAPGSDEALLFGAGVLRKGHPPVPAGTALDACT